MKLSVYLSEDTICAVLGTAGKKIRIQTCSRDHLREGTLINDVITDEAYLKEILVQMADHYPAYKNKVNLVLGSRTLTKKIPVPMMTTRQLLRLAKMELKDFSNSQEDMIYDYSVISRRNRNSPGGTILCAGIERKVVNRYIKLFEDCGMKIKTLGIALNSVLHIADYLPLLKEKTCIISGIDGRNLMSCLYVEGVYTYTSRIRLLTERNSMGIIDEVVADLLTIIKFHKMQKTKSETQQIYFCGVTALEQEELFQKVKERTGVEVQILPDDGMIQTDCGADFRLGDYLYAVGNLIGR